MIRRILSLLGATVTLVLFQNCSGGVSSGSPLYSFTALTDNEIFNINSGLRFRDRSVASPEVCDFPSLANCVNNTQGSKRGQMRYWETGLDPASPLHKLSFTFRSNGYLLRNSQAGQHLVIGLRGRVAYNDLREPTGLNGRGFILGAMSSTNSTCTSRMLASRGDYDDAHTANPLLLANQIFTNTCSDQLIQDGQNYQVELFVSRDGKIGVRVFDENQVLLHSSLSTDPNGFLNPNLTGAFFGYENPSALTNANEDWDFTLSNIQASASNESIESYFQQPFLSFYLGANSLSDNSQISIFDLNNPGASVGQFQQRTRVFACLATEASVDSFCGTSTHFSEISFTSNPYFIYQDQKLSFNGSALLSGLPTGVYTVVVRTNPESSTESRLRINKPF